MNLEGHSGNVARVDSAGRLLTFSVSEPEDKHLNQEGGVHSIYFDVTPDNANSYFFYLKNNGEHEILITDVRCSSSVPTYIYYEFVSGDPTYVTGTDTSDTNRNLGSPRQLNTESKYDTDITDLVPEGIIFFESCDTADKRVKLSTSSNIIIPQGKAVAFRREAATGALKMLVSVVDSRP